VHRTSNPGNSELENQHDIFRLLLCWVQVNGKVVFDVALPMHYSEISTLTEQQALTLAQQHCLYETAVNQQPVISHRLTIDTDSISVDLHFTVRQKKKKTTKTSTLSDQRTHNDTAGLGC